MSNTINSESIKKTAILNLAKRIKSFGLRVYLAKSGTYGFFTDGQRVISFQTDYFSIVYSGNYKSKASGSGWRIETETGENISGQEARLFLRLNAPSWTGYTDGRYTTPSEHLERFQATSGYSEI
jgi:hypothetical protein